MKELTNTELEKVNGGLHEPTVQLKCPICGKNQSFTVSKFNQMSDDTLIHCPGFIGNGHDAPKKDWK